MKMLSVALTMLLVISCAPPGPTKKDSNDDWLNKQAEVIQQVEKATRDFDCTFLGRINPTDRSWYTFLAYRCEDKKFDICYMLFYGGDGHHSIFDCAEGAKHATRIER
jgi:hypothetical protein